MMKEGKEEHFVSDGIIVIENSWNPIFIIPSEL
jgi:hypothetical protein